MRIFQKVWSVESDLHLMMSTFGMFGNLKTAAVTSSISDQMNIDGIPKELLFNRFLMKTE